MVTAADLVVPADGFLDWAEAAKASKLAENRKKLFFIFGLSVSRVQVKGYHALLSSRNPI